MQKINQSGFSLIEVLVCMLIIAFSAAALAKLNLFTSQGAMLASSRTKATSLAQSAIEKARADAAMGIPVKEDISGTTVAAATGDANSYKTKLKICYSKTNENTGGATNMNVDPGATNHENDTLVQPPEPDCDLADSKRNTLSWVQTTTEWTSSKGETERVVLVSAIPNLIKATSCTTNWDNSKGYSWGTVVTHGTGRYFVCNKTSSCPKENSGGGTPTNPRSNEGWTELNFNPCT
ncbi:type II secretion system protein [Chitinibacter sp. GC72]|uniref:type II secretion system protein n=1 Tax=Chitinibacter sp. GC72 TaxID=1526917 RepID=UPI0012F7EBD3|nr:type II secretion system protein [Chitinibacter sp. GC72]